MALRVRALVVLLFVGVAKLSYAQQCLKPQGEEVMKKAWPGRGGTDEAAMKTLCDDYVACHDKHQDMINKPDEYRKLLITCGHPHLVNFFKSRSEFKHDPEAVATEIGTCIMDHIPLTKEMGIATTYWILKILGAHE
ncbi:hypothetical protein MRX96_042078 [Rhipicephalus microplus]